MRTEVIKVIPGHTCDQAVARAAPLLADGGLVGFPTETVYGVGASAARPGAVQRLRQLKNRPTDQPFTVHIGCREEAELFVPELSAMARRMMQKGWPGPLTLVLPVADVSQAEAARRLPEGQHTVVYHQGTVGLRCPDNLIAQQVLSQAGEPVGAASANLAGHAPPRNADEAMAELDGKIDLLIDAGPTRYAKPSTIVRLNSHGYEVLRQGVYDERAIKRLTTLNLLFVCTGNTCRSPMAEGMCRQLLAQTLDCEPEQLGDHGYTVASAGTIGFDGGPASANAVAACRHRGVDIANHITQPLTVELINQADYIFTMCDHHTDTVISVVPSATERTERLDQAADIADPMGADETVYEKCAQRICQALEARLEELRT